MDTVNPMCTFKSSKKIVKKIWIGRTCNSWQLFFLIMLLASLFIDFRFYHNLQFFPTYYDCFSEDSYAILMQGISAGQNPANP
jgi:hypothetical protein